MRDRVRTFWLVLVTAFRADPWRTVGAILLEGASKVVTVLVGVWLKLLTDGIVSGETAPVVVGTAGLALMPAVFSLGMGLGTRLRLTLLERANFAFERRYAEVSASLPGLLHHEHPEFRDKLELLQQNRSILGQAANALTNNLIIAIQVVSTLIVVASLHPLLLLLPAFAIPMVVVSTAAERQWRELEERTAPLHRRARHLDELCVDPVAAKELRVFQLGWELRRRHWDAWMEAHDMTARLRWRLSVLRTGTFAVFATGFAGAVIFIALRAVEGLATPGDVVLAIAIAGQVNSTISSSVSMFEQLRRSLRYADRLRWLLDFAAGQTEGGDHPVPRRLRKGIRLEGIHFTYPGTDREVLTDVSLELPAGAVVALVGENGAGKTTLVKLLCRFYDPSIGRIFVDDTDLGTIDLSDWRSRVTSGFQDFARLEFLLRESVGVGDLMRMSDDGAVRRAFDRSGSSDVLSSVPRGLDTQLGRQWEGGVEPSGGQWQKIALARALMREHPLLTILDEPTASLDAETEHALFERYAQATRERAAAGAITILVSHRFSTVQAADVIVVLRGGRVLETGSHEELLRRQGLYAELFRIQARSYR